MAKEESREKGMIWDLEDFELKDQTRTVYDSKVPGTFFLSTSIFLIIS